MRNKNEKKEDFYHLKQAPNRFRQHQFKFEKYSTRKELPQLCKILTNICYQACRLSNILCSQGEYELKMYAFLAACPHVYQHCHLVLSSRHVVLSIGVVASLGSSLIISNCSPAHVGSLHQPNQCFNHFRHRRSELRLGLHQNVVVKDQIFTSVQKKQNPKPKAYVLYFNQKLADSCHSCLNELDIIQFSINSIKHYLDT